MRRLILLALLPLAIPVAGCSAIIEPGHRGLIFNPRYGGLQHEVLQPGRYHPGLSGRIDDFDVTYSTRKEEISTNSSEGLNINFKLAVIFRPVISELYELETEIGFNYYDEVIGPEFKSAARGVLARHSYIELQSKNDKIEDEIEAEVRKRIAGKHVEISSITMEAIEYAPEITNSVRDKLVAEQEAVRKKTLDDAENARQEMAIKNETQKAQMRADQEVRAKQHEREIAEQQAAIDKLKAQTEAEVGVVNARAEAEEATLMAKAHAEEQKAENHTLTPLAVMDHAYEALGKLGGSGTMVMLGDWSHVPNFLFPTKLLQGGMGGGALPEATHTSENTLDTTGGPRVSPVKSVDGLGGAGGKAHARRTHLARN